MTPTRWHEDNTVTEVELARQAKLGAVTDMAIVQTAEGYQVVVGLKWHPEPVAMRTRRSMTEPRLFKSLERLVAHIRERYPSMRQVRIELPSAPEPRRVSKKKAR